MKFFLQFLLLLSFLVFGQATQALVNNTVQIHPKTKSKIIEDKESYRESDLLNSGIANTSNFKRSFISTLTSTT